MNAGVTYLSWPNYSASDSDALAVIWAVEKFRSCIESVYSIHPGLFGILPSIAHVTKNIGWLVRKVGTLFPSIRPGNQVYDRALQRRPLEQEAVPSLRVNISSVAVDILRRFATEIRGKQLENLEVKAIVEIFEKRDNDDFIRYKFLRIE